MAAMQEMMRSMKAAMDAMTKGAQGENPEGPANGFKGPSSEAPAVPEGGPEQPEDRPEKSAQGPANKGPLGGKTLLTPEARGRPRWESQLGQARGGLPTRPRAKYARRPKETARPTAPARPEGLPLGAHARRVRGLEMESVGLPRRPTRKETNKANAEVEFTREEALASR